MWQFAGNTAVRWDATGTKLLPELFNTWETVDGIDYVVTVRPGVKTHNLPLTNGRLFDAEDLAANLMRISGLSDPARVANYQYRGALPGLVSARAVDSSKVQVKFSSPTPFPHGLTNYLITLMPRENFSDPATLSEPTKVSGTGPWIVSEFKVDDSMTFKRNPDYWDGRPNIDSVVWKASADRTSQISSFIQGNASYIEGVSKAEQDTIAKTAKGTQLFSWAGSSCPWVVFNMKKAPFNDVRVRQALHLATNYVQNGDAFWGVGSYTLSGVLNNAFPDGLTHDELLKTPGWRADKTADLKTANDLLTAAGFPQGQGLKFEYLSNPQLEGNDLPVRMKDNWTTAFPKMDVSIKVIDSTEQVTLVRGGNFDFAYFSAGGVSIGPASVELSRFFSSKGPDNVSGYANAEVDDLVGKAVLALDKPDASTLNKKVQDIVLRELPRIIPYRRQQTAIYAANVRGFPTLPGGTKPIVGNFDNWNAITRHISKLWLDS